MEKILLEHNGESMVLNNGESMVLNSLMQTNQWCDSSHTISTYFLPKLNVVIDFIISPFITHTRSNTENAMRLMLLS